MEATIQEPAQTVTLTKEDSKKALKLICKQFKKTAKRTAEIRKTRFNKPPLSVRQYEYETKKSFDIFEFILTVFAGAFVGYVIGLGLTTLFKNIF